MKIQKGDKLPDGKVFILDSDPKEVSIKQIIGDEKNYFIWFTRCIYTYLFCKTLTGICHGNRSA